MDDSKQHPRVGEAIAAFKAVRTGQLDRVKPIPDSPQFRTLPDGRVINQTGGTIFTPPKPPVKGK